MSPWVPLEDTNMGWSTVHQRNSWDQCGLVRITSHMPSDWCELVCERVSSSDGLAHLDFARVCLKFPDLRDVFRATQSLVRVVSGCADAECRSVIVSRYKPPAGEAEEHITEDDITGVLWLTDNAGEGYTDFMLEGLPRVRHYPVAGDLVIFKGRVIKFRCAPVERRDRVEAIFSFRTRIPVDK